MRRWSIVIAVYFCSVIACLNQYKVPPVTGMLMQQFHVDKTMVGWMMSIFSLMGIFLAFPAAILLRRFGSTKSGMTGMGCIILGCLVGGSATSVSILMTGRVIEGIGLSLISVIAPAIIAMYFKHDEIGLPMGLWATWYPIGSALGYNLTHPVTEAFGSWRGIWWVGLALAAIGLFFFASIVKRPSEDEICYGPGHKDTCISFSEGLKNSNIWFLGLAFFFMLLGSLGFLTWTPHYLAEAFKLNQGTANFYASLGFLSSAPGGVIAGFVLSKFTSKQNQIIVICAALSALTYPFAFIIPEAFIVPFLLIIGLITGFMCAAVFAMVPKVMISFSLAGLGMGVIILMQGLANLIATPAMGHIISDGQYARAVIPTAIVQILGLLAALAFAKNKTTQTIENKYASSL